MAIGTTAAVLGAAALGTAGNLVAGSKQAGAARDAANAQADATQKSIDLQRDFAKQARIDAYPWALQGAQAMYAYMDQLGIPRPVNPILPDLNSGPFAVQGYGTPNQSTYGASNTVPNATGTGVTSGGGAMPQGNMPAALGGGTISGPVQPVPAGMPGSPQHGIQARMGMDGMYGQPQALGMQGAPQPGATTPQAQPMQMTQALGFQQTPGYQFMVDEGERGIRNNLAALGMKNSGAALKALTNFRTGLANQEYQTYLNRLASAAGMGQVQTNTTNSLLGNLSSNIGQSYQNMGAARASGYVGAGNAWGNALGNTANIWGNALGMLA